MELIGRKIRAWLPENQIEPSALQQLHNVAELPFVFPHVAVMPDCHFGRGATVGSVIATKDAIIPAAVGVDVGCGMVAVRTMFRAEQLPDNLDAIRVGIERRIPTGAGGKNQKITESAATRIRALEATDQVGYRSVSDAWPAQLGSLGSGNHFIEVCLDEQDRVWVVLHSGSRGIGNLLAQRHIRVAQRLCDEAKVSLADRDLAWLTGGTPEFDAYVRDLSWAQEFARHNRDEMMDRVTTQLSHAMFDEGGHEAEIEVERTNCHHNFTCLEHHFGHDVWITRKGAIQMQQGQMGVIPGSMGTRSYIVSGRGNAESFCSAPHGAGRRFSRGEARRRFTMTDFDAAMKGIAHRRSERLIDELPGAYKDVDLVMEQSRDLVKVEHVLRQVVNVKGD